MTSPDPDPLADLDDEERAGLAYMKQLVELERAGERTTVAVGPFAAITIIGMLQLATRHPAMAPAQRRVARDFVDQMAPLFAGTPGEDIIRKGWDPERDR